MWIHPKGWRREVSSLFVFDISLGLGIVCEDLSGDLQKLISNSASQNESRWQDKCNPTRQSQCVTGQAQFPSQLLAPEQALTSLLHLLSGNSSKQEARDCRGRACWTGLLAHQIFSWGIQPVPRPAILIA